MIDLPSSGFILEDWRDSILSTTHNTPVTWNLTIDSNELFLHFQPSFEDSSVLQKETQFTTRASWLHFDILTLIFNVHDFYHLSFPSFCLWPHVWISTCNFKSHGCMLQYSILRRTVYPYLTCDSITSREAFTSQFTSPRPSFVI